jgi:hypothetical protein
MLTRWHYIALLLPLALMFLEWRRSRPVVLIALFVAIVFAALQALADTRIHTMRADAVVPISSLSRDDPTRRRVGMLHGASVLLLIGQLLAAATVVLIDDDVAG